MPCPLAFWATWRSCECRQGRLTRGRCRHRLTGNHGQPGGYLTFLPSQGAPAGGRAPQPRERRCRILRIIRPYHRCCLVRRGLICGSCGDGGRALYGSPDLSITARERSTNRGLVAATAGAEQGEGASMSTWWPVGEEPPSCLRRTCVFMAVWSYSLRASRCRMVHTWSRPMEATSASAWPSRRVSPPKSWPACEQVERPDDLAAQAHRQGMDSLETHTPGR